MTLILTAANSLHTVLVSDRRLTWNGGLVEDESNKAAVFVCENARLAVAFTGLARQGTFQTNRWLLEALADSAKPDFLMGPTILRFRDRATKDLAKVRVAEPQHKRLTIVLAGYCYSEDPPRCYCCLVSNCERIGEHPQASPWDEFQLTFDRDARPSIKEPGFVICAGYDVAMQDQDGEALLALLKAKRPAEAVIGKAVEVLRVVADSPATKGLVGKQCTSIVVPREGAQPCLESYHSSTRTRAIGGVSFVHAKRTASYCLADPLVMGTDASGRPAEVGPKLRRNDPCWCRSGKKYKRCHGA